MANWPCKRIEQKEFWEELAGLTACGSRSVLEGMGILMWPHFLSEN